MVREILEATGGATASARYLLEVNEQEGHFCSSLFRLNDEGRVESGPVAPRFYGLTAQQARRRMIDILENQYDQVVTVSKE